MIDLRNLLAAALVLLLPAAATSQGDLQIAELGECALESGAVIRECRLGYRIVGALNEEGSNAVLFPTWFTGTSEQLLGHIGPGRLIDGSGLAVIAVDAFGNGVSSSPSNSSAQPGASFPAFTVRDMVRAQHRLLTEVLELRELHAVVGVSMGGMQAFEWLVSYPAFVGRAVPIVGSPQLAPFDLLLWETQLRLIQQCLHAGCPDPGALFNLVGQLVLYTPDYRNRVTSRDEFAGYLEEVEQAAKSFRAADVASQLRAMLSHDIAEPFGGSLETAAGVVRGDLFVVVATRDHAVTPGPALAFAELLGAPVLELASDCGHIAFGCESGRIGDEISRFLDGSPPKAASLIR